MTMGKLFHWHDKVCVSVVFGVQNH